MFNDAALGKTLGILLWIFGIILFFTVIIDYRNRRKRKYTGLGELWKRYLSFLVIAPTFIFFSYQGSPFFNFLVMGMACLYLREFFNISRVWQNKVYRWEGRIFSLLVLLGTLLENKFLFFRIPLVVIAIVLATPVFLRRPQDALRQTSVTIVGILYFGWMFSYLILLRQNFDFAGVIAVCILITSNDVGCFWIGKILGRHKLIPQISPGKTIEGAIGGILCTSLLALPFQYAFSGFSRWHMIILGIVISVLGQIGDLVISVIKRDMAVKDSGALIPGHGGMLDRFDSWIFSLPFIYYLLHFLK